LAAVAAIIAAWLLFRSDSEFQVLNAVPASFQGFYVKIFADQPGDLWPYGETNGVEFVNLEANRIGIRKWEGDWEYFDIQRVHQLASDDVYADALIVFYGKPNERHIAEHRRQFVPRSNELLDVYEILSPWGGDVYQRAGTYQPIEHYRGILSPFE
jgi:hypothetical protein